MVLSQLNVLDRAGDRALAYGRATRELLDTESGLGTWMLAFTQTSNQTAHRKLMP